MSPSVRVRFAVVLVAVAAAGVVTGVVLATRQSPSPVTARCSKRPAALVVPGVSSPHTVAVRAALRQSRAQAVRTLENLAHAAPNDPVVQFNYGSALFCAGYLNEAAQAYRAAKTHGRDTFYEVKADNILHPQFFDQGYPILELTGHDPLLVQGQLLQRQGHQHSAEKLYAKAAKLHADDAEAQVAAAVGRFDEDNLSASFSHLGPLVKRFPKSQTVRYHLGLLLAWTGQRQLAAKEFRIAKALDPSSHFGRLAAEFLQGLVTGGTNSSFK